MGVRAEDSLRRRAPGRGASSACGLRGLPSLLCQRLLQESVARIATTQTPYHDAEPVRQRRYAAVAVTLGLLAVAGCMTRLTNDERTKVEFWGTVSAEAEAAVGELDEEGRGELVAALPEAERESTWEGVLDVLDDRPALEPLTDRIQTIVDQEIDAGVRVELATPSGNDRLRQLILTSIENGLATP
jgi:hypothetical protein